MTGDANTLTTREFSRLTGIPVASVARMLRQSQLRGEKRSGKWAIYRSELEKAGTSNKQETRNRPETPTVNEDVYDIDTFVAMTYLTKKGVLRWLQTGRLTGSTDTAGNASIDAANLSRPEIQYILRMK